VFDWLLDFVGGSAWAYPAVFSIVGTDAFVPILPGETAVVTGAILAANGELAIELVFLSAFAGAVAGDNVSYLLGRRLGGRAERRLLRTPGSARRVAWARAQLHVRGPWIIVAARFIPGGRTATTFSAGALGFPWPRFLAADLVGAAAWAAFSAALGWFGGSAFEDSLWKPFAVALAAGVVVAALGELHRRATETHT
jgi:membrane-associated protein